MEHKDKIINTLNQGGDSIVSNIKDEYDLTVYLLHLATIENGWSCIGIEENAKETKKVDKLPSSWNSNKDVFIIVYQSNKDPAVTFVLKCLRMGPTLLVNAMQQHNPSKIYTLDIDITQLVNSSFKLLSNYKDAFKHLDQLLVLYESSILANVAPSSPLKEASYSAPQRNQYSEEQQTSSSPYRSEPPSSHNPSFMVPPVGGGGGNYGNFGRVGGFNSGDSDLYPSGLPNLPNTVGGGVRPNFPGSGNSVGPNHPGFGRVHFPHGDDNFGSGLPFGERLPRGAVPPGARFDPFGPPGASKPSGRNNRYGDEMPPPGFNDFYS